MKRGWLHEASRGDAFDEYYEGLILQLESQFPAHRRHRCPGFHHEFIVYDFLPGIPPSLAVFAAPFA